MSSGYKSATLKVDEPLPKADRKSVLNIVAGHMSAKPTADESAQQVDMMYLRQSAIVELYVLGFSQMVEEEVEGGLYSWCSFQLYWLRLARQEEESTCFGSLDTSLPNQESLVFCKMGGVNDAKFVPGVWTLYEALNSHYSAHMQELRPDSHNSTFAGRIQY